MHVENTWILVILFKLVTVTWWMYRVYHSLQAPEFNIVADQSASFYCFAQTSEAKRNRFHSFCRVIIRLEETPGSPGFCSSVSSRSVLYLVAFSSRIWEGLQRTVKIKRLCEYVFCKVGNQNEWELQTIVFFTFRRSYPDLLSLIYRS